MEKFKGTKGKWIINKGNNVVSQHNLPIAIIYDGYTPHGSFKNEDEKDRKSNATLISKAPEMLEMLIELEMIMDKDLNPTEMHTKIQDLIKQATDVS